MMTPRFVFLTSLALVVLSQVSALGLKKKCNNCGLTSGVIDVGGCQDTVVRPPRPQKLPVPSLQEIVSSKVKLGPVEDLYTYEDTNYIHAAPVPKYISFPYHKLESTYNFDNTEARYPYSTFYPKSGGPAVVSGFETYDNSKHISDYAVEDDGYYYADNNLAVAPADPVSVTLAHELARRTGTAIKEESLNFGPRTIPKDGTVIKARKDVPEERLYSFDKQVVELRHPSVRHGVSPQEEAEEALLVAQEEGSNYGGSVNFLSYADLGYVPEIPRIQQQFVAGSSVALGDQIFPYEDEFSRLALRPCAGRSNLIVRSQDPDNYIEQQGYVYGSNERAEESYPIVRPKPCNTFVSNALPSGGYVKYTEILG